jgi:pathogenesis-related protein 1
MDRNTKLILLLIGIVVIGGGMLVLVLSHHSTNGGNGGNGGMKAPGSLPSGMKAQFLQLHNNYRAKSGAGPLRWSDDLAAGAQAWVDHQKTQEDCQMTHPNSEDEKNKYLNNNTWGQNLAHFVGSTGSPEACFQGWGPRECPSYSPTLQGTQGTGHYTQMVWKDTTEVGCAKSTCGDTTLWACDYNPSGNVRYNDGFSLYEKNVTKKC